MTIATATRGASGPYTGTGSGSAAYVYNFQVYSSAHVQVIVLGPTGTFTTLDLSPDGVTDDYTVQGVGVGTGGTVTLLANGQVWMNGSSLASGYKLYIFRTVPYTQNANLRGEGGYNPPTNEKALDLLCEADQQLNDLVARSLQVPLVDPVPSPLPAAALRANGFLAFDGSGNPMISSGPSTVPAGTLMSILDSVAALKALAVPVSAVTYLLRGYYAAGDGGGGLFRWNSADATADNGGTVIQPNAGGVGRWNRLTDGSIHVLWFGAKGDGVTNDAAAIAAAIAALPSSGNAKLVFDPGRVYFTQSEVVIGSGMNVLSVDGYGAVIKTSGSFSGMKILGGNVFGLVSVAGLQIDHRANANATYGFNLAGARDCHLVDCSVVADSGVVATYGGFRVANVTDNDPNTGSFGTRITRCTYKANSGGGKVPFGIILEGAANDTVVDGCKLTDTTVGVVVRNQGAGTYIPNSVTVKETSFETFTTGILMTGPVAGDLVGLKYKGNRFENMAGGGHVFSITGVTTPPETPTIFMEMNVPVGISAANYLNNPNSIAGIYINEYGALMGVQSISKGSNDIIGTNLAGTVTFPGTSDHVTVSLPHTEPNTNYLIFVTQWDGTGYNETFWTVNQGLRGQFRIYSSNATSVATVAWLLVRLG